MPTQTDDIDLSKQHGVAYDALPFHLQAGARRYIEDGVAPGKLLRSVVNNDFVGVSLRADHLISPFLPTIARWLYNDVPGGAWGNPDVVDAWIARGGLRGNGLPL